MKKTIRINAVVTAAVISLSSGACFAQALVGRVVAVEGGASVVRAGVVINVQPWAVIEKGDVLKTASNGRVQWRTEDDGFFSLQPNSSFVFEDYAYSDKGAANNKSFYKVDQGGFLTMSGNIKAENSYRMTMPAMSIAVHGTVYTSAVCGAGCMSADGAALPPGSYVRVQEGSVVVSNAGGSLSVAAGQSVFAPDSTTAPKLIDAPPAALIEPHDEYKVDPNGGVVPSVIERSASPS